MKIIKLRAENIKNISVVEIKPSGREVILTGKNGSGKSSVLDSILIALKNESFEKPIREGARTARISLNLGEIVVRRHITKKGSYLEIMAADGSKISSPQKLLDEIVGELTLDPVEFFRMKKKAQRALLASLAGLDEPLKALRSQYEDIFLDRRLAKKELENQRTLFASFPIAEVYNVPDKELDLRAVQMEIDGLVKKSRAWDKDNAVLEQFDRALATANEVLDRAIDTKNRAEIDLKKFKKGMAPKYTGGDEELYHLKAEEFESGVKINRLIRNKLEREDAFSIVEGKAEEVDNLQEKIERNLEEQADTIAKANYPLKKLSINDDEVLYDGLPLSQASTAEQIEISARMAMSMNPKLRVVMVRDGALIGSDIWAGIMKVAKEKDFQVWVEQFQEEAGAIGIHIVDGHIQHEAESTPDTEEVRG